MSSAKPTTTTAQVDYDDKKLHSSVKVAGEFNSWKPIDLANTHPSTKYTVTVKDLVPGHTYMYKFIIDEEWILASDGRPIISDNNGFVNHSLVAPVQEEQSDVPFEENFPTEEQDSLKPSNANEEEPVIKETVFDTEEEVEAPINSVAAPVKTTQPVPTLPVSSPDVPVIHKTSTVQTKQLKVNNEPESIEKPITESVESNKQVPLIEATTVSAVPLDEPSTTNVAKGKEADETTAQPNTERVKSHSYAEPVNSIDQVKAVEADPARKKSFTPDSSVPEAELAPTVATTDSGALAVATASNVTANQPSVSVQETVSDLPSTSSPGSVKSRLSTDTTSQGKKADTTQYNQHDYQIEQKPNNHVSTAPATSTSADTGASTSNPVVGPNDREGGNVNKRSWFSRFFGFFARLFK